MQAISQIVRTMVTRSAHAFAERHRDTARPVDEASLDEVFFHDADGRPVTYRAFNRQLEAEIGR